MEPRLYSIVNPEWAFICVGPNSYGHPHPDVLDYLTANGIRWRTTEHEAYFVLHDVGVSLAVVEEGR